MNSGKSSIETLSIRQLTPPRGAGAGEAPGASRTILFSSADSCSRGRLPGLILSFVVLGLAWTESSLARSLQQLSESVIQLNGLVLRPVISAGSMGVRIVFSVIRFAELICVVRCFRNLGLESVEIEMESGGSAGR